MYAFHFVEMQSTFFYIFRTDWNFLMKFCSSDPSFNRNILRSLYLKFKPSHKFLVIIWILNAYWGYILIGKVGEWFYQFDCVTFSKNIFWSVNCTLFYNQIYSVQMSSLYLVKELAFKVRNCTLESISRKSHVTYSWRHL